MAYFQLKCILLYNAFDSRNKPPKLASLCKKPTVASEQVSRPDGMSDLCTVILRVKTLIPVSTFM